MKKITCLILAIFVAGMLSLSAQDMVRGINKNPVNQGIGATMPNLSEIRFTENFDGAVRVLPEGWTETHSSVQEPPVMWDFDATPAFPGYHSAPNCLNYNDGIDYDDGLTNSGSVTTPAIDISGLPNVIISFYYTRQTEYFVGDESPFNIFDRVTIDVLRASDGQVLQSVDDSFLYTTDTWTAFFFPGNNQVLDEESIKIRFNFNTIDDLFNGAYGIFIDDLLVGSEMPVNGQLYASTGQFGLLLKVDENTGAATPVMPINTYGPVTEVETSADGTIWATTGGGSSNLLQINPITQDIYLVGSHPFGALNGLEFISGSLYGAFYQPGSPTSLVIVNTTNANLTTVWGLNTDNPVPGLAFNQETGILYGLNAEFGSDAPCSLFTINLGTGDINTIDVCHLITGEPVTLRGLEFGPDGRLFSGTPAGGMLVTIDPANAVVTLVGPTGYPSLSGVTFTEASAVPLANWAVFIAIGLIIMAFVVRYRKLF